MFQVLSRTIASAFRRAPKASIIILTHDNLALTTLCLDSIFRHTHGLTYELIIVDNASTDGTLDCLQELARKHKNVTLIVNDHNAGFSKGCNQGIRIARGEYIVFLNNDTIVTSGWLERLIGHLKRDPAIGLAGPVTNAAGNEAKIEVDYTDIAGIDAFAERYCQEHAGECSDLSMFPLFCGVIRRDLLQQVGLLDERYEVGMFEDRDLSLRLHRAGYRIVCAEDVFVHHFQSATFKRLGVERYLQIFEANRRRFEEKWGIRWEKPKQRRIPNPKSEARNPKQIQSTNS